MVNGCVRAFADIAGWNAAVLENLNRSGQLYVSGHRLTGDQVTDDPSLVDAKIHGSFVLAPASRSSHSRRRTQRHVAVAPEHGWNRASTRRTEWEPSPVHECVTRSPDLDERRVGAVRNFREALWLPGWSDQSIWGYDEQMDTYFAQLWRDGDVNDDPTVWISGCDPIESCMHARGADRISD